MISRYDALLIIETDILLADDRKDCVDAVKKRVEQFFDEFEKEIDIHNTNYQGIKRRVDCISKLLSDNKKID